MRNLGHKIILISVIIILLLIVFGLNFNLLKQKQETEKYKVKLDMLSLNYNSLKEKYETVNESCNALKKESSSLSVSIQETQVEIDKTIDKLEEFETIVKESMNWFRENNNLNISGYYTQKKEQLKNECMNVDTELNTCKISLSCINEINERGWASERIIYKSDSLLLTGKDDFLKSLDQIFKDNGGDCEDIALLFTAEYNFLVDECKYKGISRDKIIISSPLDEHQNVLKGNYMYPVCGDFDPNGIVSGYAGHCVVAITSSPITDTSDIYEKLKNAILVEPQSGEYLLDLSDTERIHIFKNNEIPNTMYHLYFVITEDDLKIFYKWGEDIKWMGYSDFLEKIEQLISKVEDNKK